MEDDFQFVDFKGTQRMDDVDDDDVESGLETDSENDGIVAVSDLNSLKKDVSHQLSELKLQQKKNAQEYLSLQSMKKELESKLGNLDSLIKEHTNCIKSLKEESTQYSEV